MKKIILATLSILFFSDAHSGCLQKLDNDLLSTKKQLKSMIVIFLKTIEKIIKFLFVKLTHQRAGTAIMKIN